MHLSNGSIDIYMEEDLIGIIRYLQNQKEKNYLDYLLDSGENIVCNDTGSIENI